MDNRIPSGLLYLSRPWRVLGILILISVFGGCIGKESQPSEELPTRAVGDDNLTYNLTLAQNYNTSEPISNISELSSNQVSLIVRSDEVNKSGKLPITLKITNPVLNETVLTAIVPEFAPEWYNQVNITTSNSTWNRTFNINLMQLGNSSYLLMLVQISQNNTVVKRGAWNITFGAPAVRGVAGFESQGRNSPDKIPSDNK
ncbi:MAG: hypothetical protein O8C62_00535 [Candidatus Methanoperedens sp.]|nr:hypothetical protein [Candidatus Methanoperedens sp.]